MRTPCGPSGSPGPSSRSTWNRAPGISGWGPDGRVGINDSIPGFNYDIVSGAEYAIDLRLPARQPDPRPQGAQPGRSSRTTSSPWRSTATGRPAAADIGMLAGAPVVYDRGENLRDLLIEDIRSRGYVNPEDYGAGTGASCRKRRRWPPERLFAPATAAAPAAARPPRDTDHPADLRHQRPAWRPAAEGGELVRRPPGRRHRRHQGPDGQPGPAVRLRRPPGRCRRRDAGDHPVQRRARPVGHRGPEPGGPRRGRHRQPRLRLDGGYPAPTDVRVALSLALRQHLRFRHRPASRLGHSLPDPAGRPAAGRRDRLHHAGDPGDRQGRVFWPGCGSTDPKSFRRSCRRSARPGVRPGHPAGARRRRLRFHRVQRRDPRPGPDARLRRSWT